MIYSGSIGMDIDRQQGRSQEYMYKYIRIVVNRLRATSSSTDETRNGRMWRPPNIYQMHAAEQGNCSERSNTVVPAPELTGGTYVM